MMSDQSPSSGRPASLADNGVAIRQRRGKEFPRYWATRGFRAELTACLFFLTLFLWTAVAQAELSVRLNRDQISAGETVQLQLEAEGRVSGTPDTRPLEKDFEVLGIASGSRINIINGQMEARSTWTITLSPKHSGMLVIPSLELGGEKSRPLTLEVNEVPTVNGQVAGNPIFIETELQPQEPYVQGMVSYTVRLFYAVRLLDGNLSEPELDNALVRRLGKDRQYSVQRDGQRYHVIERRYAIFPQSSGELKLPAPVLDARVPDEQARRRNPFQDFFGRDPFDDPFFGGSRLGDVLSASRPVRVRGEAHVLQVRPRPAQVNGAQWLPAERVVLSESWQPQTGALRVGDPLTRNITLRARGVTAEQLPELEPAEIAGFKVYPDRPQAETEDLMHNLEGEKRRSIAYVPVEAGDYVLPAVRIHWWDTRADKERVAELPERRVEVLPAPAAQGAPAAPPVMTGIPSAAETSSSHTAAPLQRTHPLADGAHVSDRPAPPLAGIWPWVSLLFALLWLATLILWWRGRHPATAPHTESSKTGLEQDALKARARFLEACRANDPRTARRHLLAWAAAHWPDDPPAGLDALARRLEDDETRDALAELDRSLYRGDTGSWEGGTLAQRLGRLPKSQHAAVKRAPLPDLYV